jgi:hypothetical protein
LGVKAWVTVFCPRLSVKQMESQAEAEPQPSNFGRLFFLKISKKLIHNERNKTLSE